MPKNRCRAFVVLSIIGVVLGACANPTERDTSVFRSETGELALSYVAWQEAIAHANVAKVILEENGYVVTLTETSVADAWAGVADGSYDATLSAWLPLHESYETIHAGQFQYGAPVYVDARTGLFVPSYVSITSMTELDGASSLFDSTIEGIDAGAGISITTSDMIKSDTYSLSGWTLEENSIEALVSVVATAMSKSDPIVFPLWAPHWAQAKYDLRLLHDPLYVYGDPNTIQTIVRLDLENELPGASEFFDTFEWTDFDMVDVMLAIEEGTDAAVAAKQWVDDNRAAIESALP